MGVFVAGVLGLLRRPLLLTILILGFVAIWQLEMVLDPTLPIKVENMLGLALPFALGTLLWLWRDRLVLTVWGVIALWAGTVGLLGTPVFGLMLTLALAYSTFWLAYVPRGWLRNYNRLGDYSYGVYIYAFPAQGLAVWLTGGDAMSPYANMALALPLTLIPSILSWHFVEKPALGIRKRLSASLTRTAA